MFLCQNKWKMMRDDLSLNKIMRQKKRKEKVWWWTNGLVESVCWVFLYGWNRAKNKKGDFFARYFVKHVLYIISGRRMKREKRSILQDKRWERWWIGRGKGRKWEALQTIGRRVKENPIKGWPPPPSLPRLCGPFDGRLDSTLTFGRRLPGLHWARGPDHSSVGEFRVLL